MRITNIATIALVTAMFGLGGAAYAQSMIGNQNISEADRQRVQTYCDDLKTGSEQAVGANQTTIDQSDAEKRTELGAVDLDAITLENCIEAGFVAK